MYEKIFQGFLYNDIDKTEQLNMLYGISRNNINGIGFQITQEYLKINKVKFLCSCCLKKGDDKRTCPMLKTWKDKKSYKTNKS